MSRVPTIARTDLRRAIRDRLAWAAVGLLGAMLLPSTASMAASGHYDIGEFLLLIPVDLITFALVVVAAVGYDSVAGERESGTVRLALGTAGTRRDLVFGTFLSRAAVVAFALTVVLAVSNVLLARGYGDPHLVPFWTMAGWMLAYGVVWTAVTVGYSAAFASRYRTLGALVATYAVFSPAVGVWGVLVRPVFALAFTGSAATTGYRTLANAPLWMQVTERLNPLTAFFEAMRWSVAVAGPGTPTGGAVPNLWGTVVFLCFGAVPLVLGARRFDRVDLSGDAPGSRWRGRFRGALRAVGRLANPARVTRRFGGGPSRAATVARADLRHALTDWVVFGAVALVALLVAPRLWQGLVPGGVSTEAEDVARIPYSFTLPVLVLGVAVGYRAVCGERESGTVRLALGTGGTRRDLLVGKLAARLVVVALALAPLVLFAEALVVARFGDPYPLAFLAWAGSVLALALAWTAFVVGASAAVSTRYRTLAAVFATYLLFGRGVGLWDPVVRPLVSFAFTGRPGAHEAYVYAAGGGPAWFLYTDHLNPFVALGTLRDAGFAAAGLGRADVSAPLALFSVAVVVAFAATSVAAGYARFARSDL